MPLHTPLLILGLTLVTGFPAMASINGIYLPKPLNWISGYSTTKEGVHTTTRQEMSKRLNFQNHKGEISMTFENDYTMGWISGIDFKNSVNAAMNFIELLQTGDVTAVRAHHYDLDYRDMCLTLEGNDILTDEPFKRNISGRSLDNLKSLELVGHDECSLSF